MPEGRSLSSLETTIGMEVRLVSVLFEVSQEKGERSASLVSSGSFLTDGRSFAGQDVLSSWSLKVERIRAINMEGKE